MPPQQSVDVNRLISRTLGEWVQAVSRHDVVCLRELLNPVLDISAAVSCDFAVYHKSGPVKGKGDLARNEPAIWLSVSESEAPLLSGADKIYGSSPIGDYLTSVGQVNLGEAKGLEAAVAKRRPFVGPVTIRIKGDDQKAVFVLQPLALDISGDVSTRRLCLALLNPLHIWGRSDPESAEERIEPAGVPVQVWLWWFCHQRSRLREVCLRLARGLEPDESTAKTIFRSLIRMHTLAGILAYANAGLPGRRGDDRETRDEQEKWLSAEVLDVVAGKSGSGWHNCMEDPWPPCHKGKLADRELATTLLWFCPWTSGARAKCEEVPAELGGKWHKLAIDRLWGWVPVRLGKNGRAVCGYRQGVGVDPHCMDEKSLSRLFVADFLCSHTHTPYFDPKMQHIGLEERGRSVAHVGRVLHHFLAKTALDWRTIEGLVWMVAEYGHTHLGIDHRIDIASHLLHAARTEPPLHAMQAYYRDHFFHAIEVCFLGHLLLITQDTSGRPLWKSVAEQFRAMRRAGRWQVSGTNGSQEGVSTLENVLRQWYVAALFHDVGYTIQILSAVQKMLEFYQHPHAMEQFRQHLTAALETLSSDILASDLAPLLELTREDKPGADHGIIAAAHLKELLGKLGKDAYPGSYYPAIRAIGLHNNHRAKISFQTDPLAFLLVICDTVQEWNRPHLRHTTAPAMLLSRLLAPDEEQEQTTGPLEAVSINLKRARKPAPRCNFTMEDSKVLRLSLYYGQEIQTDAGVFNLWIDSSCNLQRLSLDGFPFNIEIEFRTPYFCRPGYKPESQMRRLRDAVDETHMNFLRDWLPSSSGGTDATKAVRYHSVTGANEADYDVLTLDLRHLADHKVIKGNVSQFRDCLRNWKRWNEDRDYAGDYAPRIPGL